MPAVGTTAWWLARIPGDLSVLVVLLVLSLGLARFERGPSAGRTRTLVPALAVAGVLATVPPFWAMEFGLDLGCSSGAPPRSSTAVLLARGRAGRPRPEARPDPHGRVRGAKGSIPTPRALVSTIRIVGGSGSAAPGQGGERRSRHRPPPSRSPAVPIVPLPFEVVSLGVIVLILIADIALAYRRPQVPSTRESTLWVVFYVALALVFALCCCSPSTGRRTRRSSSPAG